MLKIGLTGGIGSGKNKVTQYFQELGVPIIDADVIAHELVLPLQPAYLAIINKFGSGILMPQGNIDRLKLRRTIFNDYKLKKWLENLLHPFIKQAIHQQAKVFTYPYCIIAIPLLIETQSFDLVDRVLVIDCDQQLQVERTIARDNISEAEVLKIIATQATAQQRQVSASEIIENNSTLEALKQQVIKLHHFYHALVTH